MSRLFVLLCITTLCGVLGVSAVAPAARAADASTAPTPISLDNEFIRVVVNPGPDEAGRFSIRTTGGDPSRPLSRDKHLIYGGDQPWTSYTTLRIDGASYVLGGPTHRRAGVDGQYGQTTLAPCVKDNTIDYRETIGDLDVTQELTFVRGLGSRMFDTVGITYTVVNHGAVPHQVGLRMLLDTQCGDNDGAPFRAGKNNINTATWLSGKDMPDYWQAFDDLKTPSVICQGSLRGADITPPDKVLFADWGTIADELWEPEISADQGFIRKGETDPDTACAMYWNPTTLEPGKSLAKVSYFGIGNVDVKPGVLTLGLTAPAETTFAQERTDTFSLIGYVQNTGGFDAHNVVLTLDVPDGFTLVGGDSTRITQSELKVGDTMQLSWTLISNGRFGGKCPLKLSIATSNIEPNSITRDITVNVPNPKLSFKPADHRLAVTDDGGMPQPVVMECNLSPAVQFAGIDITVQFDPKVVLPFDISRGRAFLDNDDPLVWSVDRAKIDQGLLMLSGRRQHTDALGTPVAPLTQAEINIATLVFRTVAPGISKVTFTNAVMIDANGRQLPLKFDDGAIEVVGNTSPSSAVVPPPVSLPPLPVPAPPTPALTVPAPAPAAAPAPAD